MSTDYESFLRVTEDGRIWWLRQDAIRLGAGFLPRYDDNLTLNTELRAPNRRALANERTLIGALGDGRLTILQPTKLERDGCCYVDAAEFLEWLSQYICLKQSKIDFPTELVSRVRVALAEAAAEQPPQEPQTFESLTLALEGWFDKDLDELPVALRQRVEKEFIPMPWDTLTSEQKQQLAFMTAGNQRKVALAAANRRRSIALQWDYKNDPATEQDRQFWLDFYLRKEDIKKQITNWGKAATPTAGEIALKESRLTDLRHELDQLDKQQRVARGKYYPQRMQLASAVETATTKPDYLAFPKALKLLGDRIGAVPEELAAWVWLSQKDGGLDSYRNANELNPPPRFCYSIGSSDDFNYIAPLMGCWFRADDVAKFEPADRYITGAVLIERWGKQPSIQPEAFILAKIAESRLSDIHPIYGGTQGSFPDELSYPPLSIGLFGLSEVEAIEAEDFDVDETREADPSDTPQAEVDLDDERTLANSKNPCDVFLAMENLTADKLKIAFVGDKPESEYSLAANNYLKIYVDEKALAKVAFTDLELLDAVTRGLNRQGRMLLDFTWERNLTDTPAITKAVSRLRGIFRQHLGIKSDPFDPKDARWKPRFKVVDKRGAADERAKQEATGSKTRSYEDREMADDSHQTSQSTEEEYPFEDNDDSTAEFLKERRNAS